MYKTLIFVILLAPSIASASWFDSAPETVAKVKKQYGPTVRKLCKCQNIDENLVMSVISVESNGNPLALSSAKAKGLMQIKDEAANDVGVMANLFHPSTNILAGSRYLDSLHARYGFRGLGEIALAYTKGPTGARNYLVKHKIESSEYVKRVEHAYYLLLLLEI